jgi:hypothetical protein
MEEMQEITSRLNFLKDELFIELLQKFWPLVGFAQSADQRNLR